ncbi:MAG: type II secretion system protein [Eubacteriales bacterium]
MQQPNTRLNKMLTTHPNDGFTLAELMIVVVMLVSLTTLFMISLIRYVDYSRKGADIYNGTYIINVIANSVYISEKINQEIKDQGNVKLRWNFDGNLEFLSPVGNFPLLENELGNTLSGLEMLPTIESHWAHEMGEGPVFGVYYDHEGMHFTVTPDEWAEVLDLEFVD